MVSILFLTLLLFCMIGCSGNSAHRRVVGIKDTIHKTKPAKLFKPGYGDDDPEPSFATILNDQLRSYNHITKIDTTFLLDLHDTLTVKLRHYCVYDDDIELPAKWIKMYHLNKFRAHSFVTALIMKLNSKVVFNGLIKKKDFNQLLFENLKKYAVLLDPAIKVSSNGLTLGYSISVPLSDVGQRFRMNIDTLGKKHVSQ